MVKRVCLVSSGTGGHLWPALVLGEALRQQGHETFLLTEGRAVERELLSRVGCPAEELDVRGQGIGQVMRVATGTLEARRLLRAREADAVVSTGGRTSVVVGLAARSLGLPLALLEQNAVVGRANRMLARFARRVYLGLPTTASMRRGVVTGTPLREDLRDADRAAARQRLGLAADQPVVLVTGGSQGAGVLNEVVPDALCSLRSPIQVLHLAGSGNDDAVRRRYVPGLDDGVSAQVRAMSAEMAPLYAAADLVICRGGGCTVAELIATGRPAVVVPYPHHRDMQQLHNARVLESAGAARIVAQSDFDVESCARLVHGLLNEPTELQRMEAAARKLAPAGDAAALIVNDLENTVFVN